MNHFIYQIKQAWGSLRQKPGFLVTVVVTMGTTLGALLCVLTLAYLLVLQPLPYPEQDRLYNVTHAMGDKSNETNPKAFTYPGLIHLYKNQQFFEKTALLQYAEDILTSLPNQPTLNTGYVTPQWFELLGATLKMGRVFEQTEALDTFNPVAIISYKTWRQEFAAAPDMLDKKVSFSGVTYCVVGVLSKDFVEPQINQVGKEVGIWFPWDYNFDVRLKESWGYMSPASIFVGQLKNGVSPDKAQQSLTPLVNETWAEHVASIPFFSGWSIKIELEPFQTVVMGESNNTAFLLLAGVLGLVLIAFANMANLFISRTAEQQRQLAIRAALGATKYQLFRGLLAESGLLMLLSVLLALVIASLGFSLLQAYMSSVLPRVDELRMNTITLVAAVFCAVLFAFLFAFLSRRAINYRTLNSMLQSSGKGTGVQVSKFFRQSLIVSQVAIATVLVFVNVSLFKQAMGTITEPTDFSVQNMSQLSLAVSAAEMPPPEEVSAVMTELKKKLLELPQVESISQSVSVLDGFGLRALIAIASGESFTLESKHVSNNYFQMMAQPLLEGDYFSDADIKDGTEVIIVNDVFAKHLSPDGSAIGLQVSPPSSSDRLTIVGVVKGVKMPAQTDIPMRVYTPLNLAPTQMTLKLQEGQSISREQVVSAIKGVSNLYALFSLQTLTDVKQRRLFTQYTSAITTSALTFITLFLAGIGLYGILSYSTQIRRFEIGTRLAIGAKRSDVVKLIVKDNASMILLGMLTSVVVLLVLYLGFNENLNVYISGNSGNLATAFVLTVAPITLLSLFACYWPLRKYINQPVVHSLRGSD
jgi:predicted permease